jgi:regulator of sirC expression with transglutaminase-like and TPR domain
MTFSALNPSKVIFSSLAFVLLCTGAALALLDPSEIPHRRLKGLDALTLEEILALPEDQIDVGTAALIIANTWNQNITVAKERANLDLLSVHLAKHLRATDAPQSQVNELKQYIFSTLGYQGVNAVNDPNDFFLDSVMRGRQGYCLGLSVFLLSLAERVDLPLYGVAVPGHFFVRYDDGTYKENLEIVQKGATFDDDYYRTHYGVKPGDPFYLRNLKKKEVIGALLSNFGNHLLAAGRLDDAFRALRLSVELVPQLAEAHSNLGVAYLRKRNPQEALLQEQMAIAITPQDARSCANLAAAMCELGCLDDALTQVRVALSLDPKLPEALVTLGVIYGSKDLLDASIEQYKKAIELNPRYALAYADLGITYIKKGMLKDAIEKLKYALEIDPGLAEAHLNLAAAYERAGELSLAREHLNRARSLGLNILSTQTSTRPGEATTP